MPLILPPAPDIVDPLLAFAVRTTNDSDIGRDQLIEELSNRGIGTSVHYVPLHRSHFGGIPVRYQMISFQILSEYTNLFSVAHIHTIV